MGVSPSKSFGPESSKILTKSVEVKESSGEPEYATFAAGCFWSVELAFQRVPGILSTQVGYTQGIKKSPTYEEVCTGATGHAEAVQLTYDPEIVSYEELLTVLWDIHNPTTRNRQGNDVGSQYRSGIYYHSEEQKRIATESKKKEQWKYKDAPIVTEIMKAAEWYAAEEYHQQYLQKGGQCANKGSLTPIKCYG